MHGFQIKYEVRESTLGKEAGMGIFTKQFIPSGTLIWKYSPDSNVKQYHTEEEVRTALETMDAPACEFFMSHVYLFDGKTNEILDDGKFWNHVSWIGLDSVNE